MRILARLALVAILLGTLAVAALVYDRGEHIAIPGLTRDSTGGRVVEVIDGDTLDVAIDDVRTRVHLAGAVAPRLAEGDLPAECLAPEAHAALKYLAPIGSRVLLRSVTPNDDGSLTATVHHRLSLIDADMVAAGLATASDAAIAGAPAAAERALPIPDPKGWLAGYESRAHAGDLAQVVDARRIAVNHHVGLYDIQPECTLPARVAAAVNQASDATVMPETVADMVALDVAGRSAALPPLAEALAALTAELDGDRATLPLRAFDDEQLTALRAQLAAAGQKVAEAPEQFAIKHAAGVAAAPPASTTAAPAEPAPPASPVDSGTVAEAIAAGAAAERATAPTQPPAGGALTDASAPGAGDARPMYPGQDPNDPVNDPAVIATLSYDAQYTGCRAYAGFTPDALDERNRPYAKVDCNTRPPIG